MAYLRFRRSDPAATLATFATVSLPFRYKPAATLTTFATLPPARPRTVANVASVAGVVGSIPDLKVAIADRTGPCANHVPPVSRGCAAHVPGELVLRGCTTSFRELQNRTEADALRLPAHWRARAASLGWQADDFFAPPSGEPADRDAPNGARHGGLIWWLQGETIKDIWITYAFTLSGRVFDRTRQTEVPLAIKPEE